MPNYCRNQLILKGEKKALQKFLKKYPTLDLQEIMPLPDDECDASSVWGTKWTTSSVSSTLADKLSYRFSTAWNPFNNEVLKIISTFPGITKATLRYAERGMEFCGKVVMKGDRIVNMYDRKILPSEIEEKETESGDEATEYHGVFADLWEESG